MRPIWIVLGVIILVAAVAGGIAISSLLWSLLILALIALLGLAIAFCLTLTLTVAGATIHRLYHYARGRRDRGAGIPCAQCGRRAFPIGGTTTRYHCVTCDARFAGPEHFD